MDAGLAHPWYLPAAAVERFGRCRRPDSSSDSHYRACHLRIAASTLCTGLRVNGERIMTTPAAVN